MFHKCIVFAYFHCNFHSRLNWLVAIAGLASFGCRMLQWIIGHEAVINHLTHSSILVNISC